MLTKWRHVSTSFEHSTGTAGATNGSNSSPGEIAISFVKPLTRDDPFYNERVNSSKNGGKKRRKSAKDRVEGSSSIDGLEPVLCITSPHRVALLGYPFSNSGASFSESKSRNYVSRPGKCTSFHLTTNANSFKGLVSCGAQYEPTSNLIYAIRNKGAELAIWTAASSSFIQGPDQVIGVNVGEEALVNVNHVTKKRKERETSFTFDRVISQRLSFPEGKTAVTMTPFCVPSSSPGEENRFVAIGASGCCDDGCVWIAIRRNTNDDSPFKVFVVDGSSMADTEINQTTNTTKSTRRKGAGGKAKEKKKLEDVPANWRLLDSRVVKVNGSGNDKHAGLISVHIRSVVLLSKDEGSVILRHHQIGVYKEGCEEKYQIQQTTNQTILKVSNKDSIAAYLDNFGNSLCIVHKNVKGYWSLSTVELPSLYGNILRSPSTLALSRESEGRGDLFSFGSLGQDMYAILLKKESKTSDQQHLFTLRVFDAKRKIDLFMQSWFETDTQHDRPVVSDSAMTKVMQGKHCHAMITNELDGSLALVTSSTDNSESFDIMISTITTTKISSSSILDDEITSKASSLASALRAVASSERPLTNDSIAANLYSCHTISIPLSRSDRLVNQKYPGTAVDIACKYLSDAAKSLLESILDCKAVDKKLISNGKSRKDAGAKTSALQPRNWKDAFLDGMAMIQESSNSNLIVTSALTNGMKNGMKGESKRHKNRNVKELPKPYIDIAFRSTISLLLSIPKSAKYSNDDVKMKLEAIHQEALFVLLKTLQAECLSSRADLDVFLLSGGNVLLRVLRMSSSVLGCSDDLLWVPSKTPLEKHRLIGVLDILDAMLSHVRDLSERVLVCMIQCLLRNVGVDDVVRYYTQDLEAFQGNRSWEGSRLSHKFVGLIANSDITDDARSQMATKLIAKALLDFTSKIVMYSKCNHSVLSKSLRSIISTPEVETLLVTLSKLLKYGDGFANRSRNASSFEKGSEYCPESLYSRVIDWICALTDAHMLSILRISDQGCLVMDGIQADVRSALIQTETANKLKYMVDCVVASSSERSKQSSTSTRKWMSRESTVAAYSIERLTF